MARVGKAAAGDGRAGTGSRNQTINVPTNRFYSMGEQSNQPKRNIVS